MVSIHTEAGHSYGEHTHRSIPKQCFLMHWVTQCVSYSVDL